MPPHGASTGPVTHQDAYTSVIGALTAARHAVAPFPHWHMENVLPPSVTAALLAWDPGATFHAGENDGRRDVRNGRRIFVTPAVRDRDADLDLLAHLFDAPAARRHFERTCHIDLAHTFLRLELCLDTDGFWLSPHTDIGAKRLTLLISLSIDPDAHEWGTDLLTPQGRPVARASGAFNSGLLFIPSDRSWHGFVRRPITGLRRTLIVNYVGPEWQSRGELAFPPQ
ncbi:2OG-Fe(II) oxygenase [Novacetimonas cocois]|uniref:2OG-Fe(II) oxygenase n=1 Tax=Novacetimonas cocois TaxID=1747507 RepID=UPI001EF0821B|nr:2OG-Fe(II) oxygenase [Novacetimonas cocois]